MDSEDLYSGLVPPEGGVTTPDERRRGVTTPDERRRVGAKNEEQYRHPERTRESDGPKQPIPPRTNKSSSTPSQAPRETNFSNQLVTFLFEINRKVEMIHQNIYQININLGDLGRRMSALEKTVQINNVTQNILTVKGSQDQLRQSIESDLNQAIDKISAYVNTYREKKPQSPTNSSEKNLS